MQYVNLGKSGLKVSRLCLGMMTYGTPTWRPWVLDEDASRPFIKKALDAGINFFDTADMYSLGVSEELTGKLLREFGVKRENAVIATKLFFNLTDEINAGGLSRKHIMDAIDASLTRLGMDYVDLYQIHRWDHETPIEETMEALHDVVKAGKARYIGASSMYAWQFAKAQHIADANGWTRFASMQNHYNLVYREEEREMIPLCIDQGVGLIPWSPLARGFLAGNRKRDGGGDTARSKSDDFANEMYFRENDFTIIERVQEIAKNHGVTNAQIALAWMLSKSHITAPIIGASKMAHLNQAIAALEIELTEDEISSLEEAYQPHPVLGHS
ncbi:MAG: aldo/keto reductase [Anaerolineae bacterium]|jgi:aryl-alcohol dehydrogenase (NADP+)|nr:aldo/keto reductase [Anaerolineae bacterium]MBT3711893.1 aldo/keto reductase [Anaerolineae bacterium]MBT4311234.1 aldo/keto reductase [Anaerolineae bacterium]MBT4459965.1 aldo/keto reductase [Anaerolineae bacterium]MBT4843568.1 aldo/keto reductase [Anaerolineae bacterium]